MEQLPADTHRAKRLAVEVLFLFVAMFVIGLSADSTATILIATGVCVLLCFAIEMYLTGRVYAAAWKIGVARRRGRERRGLHSDE